MPYRLIYPETVFFIAVGVYGTSNSLFELGEVLVFGIMGVILILLDFPVAPIHLGYVLGPNVEGYLRRALSMSNGDLAVFAT